MADRKLAWTLALVLAAPAGCTGQDRPAPRAGFVAYEAEVAATIAGRTCEAFLWYDRGRFRQVTRFPGTPRSIPPSYTELYDGSSPPVVWQGDFTRRALRPDGWSINQALSREAQVDGVDTVRRRYGIPADRRIRARPSAHPPRPLYGLPFAQEILSRGQWRALGSETVAGQRCRIHERQESGPQQGPPTAERIWVEPRTGLVLKRTVHRGAVPGNPAPPQSEEYAVRRLKLVDHVPAERFRIPAGFTAVIPRLFKDVTLPPGVRREAAKGAWAATRIAYQ